MLFWYWTGVASVLNTFGVHSNQGEVPVTETSSTDGTQIGTELFPITDAEIRVDEVIAQFILHTCFKNNKITCVYSSIVHRLANTHARLHVTFIYVYNTIQVSLQYFM